MEPSKPIPPPLPNPSYNPPYVPSPTQSVEPAQKIEFAQSILDRAKLNDRDAIELMFRQFIGSDEKIHFCEYMGQFGVVISITHSFACVTDKRILSLKVGSFEEVVYQDAGLEDLNSGVIYQPSILGLYIIGGLVVLFTYGLGILLLPFVVKWYYKVNKCGLVGVVKEGLAVYVFVNRNRLVRANAMWRTCLELRDSRIKAIR